MNDYVSNPYSGLSFFHFITQLFKRLGLLLSDQTDLTLASDELQIAVLASIAVSGALVGTFLVLRRMTMLANALSHTILLGIAIAFFFASDVHDQYNVTIFMLASFVMAMLTTFITQFLTEHLKLQADASIGITFTSLFALGILFVTALTRNAHIGTEAVMGNVDALQKSDLTLAFWIAVVNILLIVLFFKEYMITTFDSGLATALGISSIFFNYLLMAQTSFTVVSGFRAVGVLMVLAFITAPVLTARLFCNRLSTLLFFSALTGVVASVTGVAFARHFLSYYGIALSTSGVTVCVLTFFFLIGLIIKKIDLFLYNKRDVDNSTFDDRMISR